MLSNWRSVFNEWKRKCRDPITYFTFLLVVVGFLQWCTYLRTNEILTADQRAWVGADGIEVPTLPNIGELLAVSFKYANFGKEPAKNVDFDRIRNFTATIPSNVPPELVPKFDSQCNIDGPDAEGRATNETCKERIDKEIAQCRATKATPAGRVVYPGKGTFPLPIGKDAMRANINTPERIIVISGCVTYLTFEQVHYSAFCYYYRGGQSPAQSMKLCPIGNDAN